MRNRQPYIWRNTILSLTNRILGTRMKRLDYDGQTGEFAVGETVTGDAGAVGVVAYIIDVTDTGTLYLISVDVSVDVFVNNEGLTGDGTGVAVVNGTLY